jgi:hypothetical protein
VLQAAGICVLALPTAAAAASEVELDGGGATASVEFQADEDHPDRIFLMIWEA